MMRGPAAFLAEHSSQTFITNKHGNDRRRKQQHEIPDTFNRTITMGHRQVLSSSSDPPDSSSHPTVQIKDADDTDSHSNGRSTSNAIDPEIDIKIETSIKADTFVDSENDESKPNPDHIDLDSGKSYVKRDHSNTSNLHETKDEEERENNDNDCAFVHNTVLYNESSSDTVIVHGTFDISTENKNPSDAENKQIENKKVNDNEECNEGKIRTMEHALREQEVPTAYLDMFMNTDSNGVKAATVNANMGVNDSNDHALCTYEHAATAAAAAVEEKFVWMVMEYAPLGSVRDIMAVTKRTFGEYRVSYTHTSESLCIQCGAISSSVIISLSVYTRMHACCHLYIMCVFSFLF